MDEAQNEDELNAVLDALSVTNAFPNASPALPTVTDVPSVSAALDVDILYIDLIQRIKLSLDNNMDILNEASKVTKMVGDAQFLEAYSSVAKSNSELLKTLTGAITERDKITTQERLKDKDLAVKKELANLKLADKDALNLPAGAKAVQNNYYITAPRETMFKALFGKNDAEKTKAQEVIKKMNEMNEPVPEVVEAEVV